jgi:hypothetical protein
MTPESVRSRELAAAGVALLSLVAGLVPYLFVAMILVVPDSVRRSPPVDLMGPLAICGAPVIAPLLGLAAVAAGVGAWRESRAHTERPSGVGGVAVVVGLGALLSSASVLLLLLVGGMRL